MISGIAPKMKPVPVMKTALATKPAPTIQRKRNEKYMYGLEKLIKNEAKKLSQIKEL